MTKVYTVAELQDVLKIGRSTAYDLLRQPGFPAVKIKTTYRIPAVALDAWLASQNNKQNTNQLACWK